MDISREYILQCERAGEIQEEWKPQLYDYTYHPLNGVKCVVDIIERTKNYARLTVWRSTYNLSCELIWLPTQSQLQEILRKLYERKYPHQFDKQHPYNGILIHELWKFSGVCVNSVLTKNDYKLSWEQLWLAFVMHEKYSKQWLTEKGEWE